VRTVVIQSYRTNGAEPWMLRCMQSVQEWATARGYSYEFVDDALFDFLPATIRTDSNTPLLVKTDIARLGLLEDRLKHGRERAIWLDADVLIFDPDAFAMPEVCGAMFCHEIWTSFNPQGELIHRRGINNALMLFERGHPLLAFLRYASMELYQHRDPASMSPVALGTDLLSKLGRLVPLRLNTQVACLSPLLLAAIYHTDHPEWLHTHAQQHGHRVCAANLCRSLLVDSSNLLRPRHLDTTQMQTLVEQLIATRGSVLTSETRHA
jgi:hypothetical protein